MNKDLIAKIITIMDLELDALFFNLCLSKADEKDIKIIYKNIGEKLKKL